ncbi:hypothetical protein Tco_0029374 [Tanacetum coccineum]
MIMGYSDNPKQGFDYLPWTDSETVFLWDCKYACCSSKEQKDHAIRYPCAWALIMLHRNKSSISVDPPVTSVEFVTSVLAATPCSSHPTWGIEVILAFDIFDLLALTTTSLLSFFYVLSPQM